MSHFEEIRCVQGAVAHAVCQTGPICARIGLEQHPFVGIVSDLRSQRFKYLRVAGKQGCILVPSAEFVAKCNMVAGWFKSAA